MTRKNVILGLSAAALISGAAIGGAAVAANQDPAGHDERDEIAAVNGANVSLAQAVAIAEREGAGKAMEASFDDESERGWEVEIASGNRVTTYFVNADSGAAAVAAAESDEPDGADEGPEDND